MLHISDRCFGKRSDKNSIREGLVGFLSDRDYAVIIIRNMNINGGRI